MTHPVLIFLLGVVAGAVAMYGALRGKSTPDDYER